MTNQPTIDDECPNGVITR